MATQLSPSQFMGLVLSETADQSKQMLKNCPARHAVAFAKAGAPVEWIDMVAFSTAKVFLQLSWRKTSRIKDLLENLRRRRRRIYVDCRIRFRLGRWSRRFFHDRRVSL